MPDAANMAELSRLADLARGDARRRARDRVRRQLGQPRLGARAGVDVGRINDLRLGESILLGREPLHRDPIDGLHTDAFTLVAEVIEAKVKPSRPWGSVAQTAFGAPPPAVDRGRPPTGCILALGHQDVDPDGLTPPAGLRRCSGASSDHLVLDAGDAVAVGAELRFGLDYSALLRAATSSSVDLLTLEQPVPAGTGP